VPTKVVGDDFIQKYGVTGGVEKAYTLSRLRQEEEWL
jgi:hypothetical protein